MRRSTSLSLFLVLGLLCLAQPGAGPAFAQQATATPPPPTLDPNFTPPPFEPILTATPQADGAIVHEVGPGQTLWSIAVSYGVTIEEIRQLNGLAAGSTDIYTGQKLIIRPAGSATPPTAGPDTPAPTLQPTRTRRPTATAPPTATRRPSATLPLTQTPSPTPDSLLAGLQLPDTRMLGLILLVVSGVGIVLVIIFGFIRK